MTRQPAYPKEASVGDEASSAGQPGKASVPASAAEPSSRKKHLAAGAAIGIGSAALVAALLYSRKRKVDR